MGFLALAIACSVGIATIFNLAERRGLDRMALLTVNYAAAAVLAVWLQGLEPVSGVSAGLVALGVAQGVLFIGGFLLFSMAIRQAGMGLAAGVMRLSVLVPVLASWWIWSEVPSLLQGAGLALGGIAFFLVARPSRSPVVTPDASAGTRATLLLGLLFLAGGCVDLLMKVFSEVYRPTMPSSLFLLFVFGVAFAVGLVSVLLTGFRTGRWPRGEVLALGVVLGLINYGSADFLIRAIAVLDGPLVFPANSIGVVLGAALVGFVVWQERLSRVNLAGLALAAVALVLLAR
jgi:drug/metabolite transporter (DMT)-like permease